MTDLTSASNKIQEQEVRYLDPQSISYYQKVSASINDLIDNVSNTVIIGEVKKSILTENQFQQRRGSGWVIMAGQDITGSEFATLTGISTLPDLRGKYVRAHDDGTAAVDPDAPRTLGDEQNSENDEHSHISSGTSDSTPPNLVDSPGSPIGFNQGITSSGYINYGSGATIVYERGLTSYNGTPSMEPESYAINFFIRINT